MAYDLSPLQLAAYRSDCDDREAGPNLRAEVRFYFRSGVTVRNLLRAFKEFGHHGYVVDVALERLAREEKHHPACALHVDPCLRCTCAREQAYDAQVGRSPAQWQPLP